MFAPLERLVAWFKAGYPAGIPEEDVLPVMALLRRRLSDQEVQQVGEELERKGLLPMRPLDVGAAYLKRTDQVPSPEELARVGQRLDEAGWPLHDARWPDDGPPIVG
ncbi:DUF3349 domain-containing protein [Nigerium massiliense]|uniref:DUF3349 domain-containing protein n=1 Tax=Nigerium massiliense TaxID=1522317 RepID=UPI00058D5F7E|nr:DUF3349 domain-containing protein [Nigerium massiliense]